MDSLTEILQILSLLIQFVGALLIYKSASYNDVPWILALADARGNRVEFKRKKKILEYGFLILTLGIVLGLISFILNMINVPQIDP